MSIEYDKDNTEYILSNGKITKKEIKEITTKDFSNNTKDINLDHFRKVARALYHYISYNLEDLQPYFIALTAYAQNGDKSRFIKLGFDEYIAKPIQTDDLRRVLMKYERLTV